MQSSTSRTLCPAYGVTPVDTRAVWALIAARDATATATVQALREQIAALTDHLVRAESELADLATTRQILAALTGQPDPAPQADATIASIAYQQILAVFATAATGHARQGRMPRPGPRHRYRSDRLAHRRPVQPFDVDAALAELPVLECTLATHTRNTSGTCRRSRPASGAHSCIGCAAIRRIEVR